MLGRNKLLLTAIALSLALPNVADCKEQQPQGQQQSNPKQQSAANQQSKPKQQQQSTTGSTHPDVKSSPNKREQKGATEAGLQLGQWNKLLGPTTISSTKNAIRIYSNLNHIVILAKAPDWDVIEFNMDTKTYCKMEFARAKPMMQKTIAIFSGDLLAMAPVVPIKTGTVLGISATQMRSPRSYYKQQILRSQQKLCEHASPRTVELTVTKDDSINPKAASIALRLMALPMCPLASIGFPLECSFADISGDPHRMLQTLSAKKQPIPLSTFALPVGYRKVNDPAELYANPARDEDVTELLKEPERHR